MTIVTNDQQALLDYVTGLGDDALILGQRLAEWCSNGPFLEEDLALSNVALDILGRAQMFYDYAAEIHNAASPEAPITTDDIAYLRDARQYTNTLIQELPIGDFAYTMARQFIIDSVGVQFMQALTQSSDKTLSAIAGKAIKESHYHLRRSRDWVIRLGDGTDESHQRIQSAFDQLWGYTDELFQMTDGETSLLASGVSVDKAALLSAWHSEVENTFTEATLTIPTDEWRISGGRNGVHTEHLGQVLAELQYLQRAYPGLSW
jgi:ring-1,2-phenylacetyl-CoA epoxidase subunit PaaC